MAKQQKQPAALDPERVSQLAEKLFVAHWPGPKSSYEASHTVEGCFKAAEAFVNHAVGNRPETRTTEAEPETTTTET